MANLALDHVLAHALALRPFDQQVGPSAAQSVFALDPAAAVHDPLQERLQEQVRSGLLVVEPLDPALGLLAKELLEAGQQLVQPQRAGCVHVPSRVLLQLELRRPGGLPGHDLGVDRVGQPHRRIAGDESQVLHVLDVVGGGLEPVAADQQGLDHPPHPVLLELVGQLVQMGVAAQDQLLAGCQHVGLGHCAGAVGRQLAAEACFVGQGVDEPRLALGLVPYCFQRAVGEGLAGFFSVLTQQGARVAW